MGKKSVRLLVLVPHRDVRLPLQSWSAALSIADLPGAGTFPAAAPLARIKRTLSSAELKRLARAMRQHIDHTGGTIHTGLPSTIDLPRYLDNHPISVWGPALPLALPDDFFAAVSDAPITCITPPVLGIALAQKPLPDMLPSPPSFSFRAAALANMICRFLPLGADRQAGYCFEWKIGTLHWLPGKPAE